MTESAQSIAPSSYRWEWYDFRSNRNALRLGYVGRGLFRDILDECWASGSVADDKRQIANICGCPENVLVEHWDLLRKLLIDIGGGRLSIKSIEEQRIKIDLKRELCSAAGVLGGSARPSKSGKPTKKTGRLNNDAWSEIRGRIFKRDDYTCTYCGERGGKLECDHKNPLSLGGSHEDDNLTTACFKCNRSKRAMTLEDWMKKISGERP